MVFFAHQLLICITTIFNFFLAANFYKCTPNEQAKFGIKTIKLKTKPIVTKISKTDAITEMKNQSAKIEKYLSKSILLNTDNCGERRNEFDIKSVRFSKATHVVPPKNFQQKSNVLLKSSAKSIDVARCKKIAKLLSDADFKSNTNFFHKKIIKNVRK